MIKNIFLLASSSMPNIFDPTPFDLFGLCFVMLVIIGIAISFDNGGNKK